MARGRHRNVPIRRKPINRHWTGVGQGAFSLAAGTVGATIFGAVHMVETLMRFRGNLVAWVDGTEAPAVSAQIGVGLILVPEGTGTTVTWSPLSDPDASWMYYSSFILGYEEQVTDVISVQGLSIYREKIDSKAMRVVRPDTELQVVFENVTFEAALSVNLHLTGRILSQS